MRKYLFVTNKVYILAVNDAVRNINYLDDLETIIFVYRLNVNIFHPCKNITLFFFLQNVIILNCKYYWNS